MTDIDYSGPLNAIELAALAVVAPTFAFGLWAYWRIMGTRATVMVVGSTYGVSATQIQRIRSGASRAYVV